MTTTKSFARQFALRRAVSLARLAGLAGILPVLALTHGCGGSSSRSGSPDASADSTGSADSAGSAGSAGSGGSGGSGANDGGKGADSQSGDGSSETFVDAGVCDSCAAGAIYVAPNGSDSNPGTLDQPVQTLAKAQALVQPRTAAMTSDITVYLRGGTYPVTSSVTFANADSGQNGHYVKYMAYPGERPLITGGQPITGWKVFDAGTNVYSASGVMTPFRQVYVNGVKAVRARSPNLGANGAANFYRITGEDKTSTPPNIQVASSQVANWNNFTKVEMHIMIGWADATLRLASEETQGTTALLTVQAAEQAIVFPRENPNLGGQFGGGTKHAFYFENALEFLDQPGEWYLDETANVLYYMPRTGEEMTTATVVAPMVETLLSVNGTSTSDQAGYLWFEGLTFAHSTYMRPSQYGFVDAQAGEYDLTVGPGNDQTIGRPAAGVTVTNANHIQFQGNMFTQMAATGLDFISGTHNDVILGNVFTDIGGSGISIGKFTASDTTEFHIAYNPTDTNEICTSDTIKDNYIYNVTTEIQGACGIAGGYPREVDIEHNEVAQANYSGISVGFGWTTCANAMSNNIINYNNIHDITHILADGASIYTLSNQLPASQMEYNYVHDYETSQWADYGDNGLYLDEGTRGYTVAHNVMVNCPTNIVQNGNDSLDPCQLSGSNTNTDNSGTSQSTISAAGIESAYVGIKNMTVPLPTF